MVQYVLAGILAVVRQVPLALVRGNLKAVTSTWRDGNIKGNDVQPRSILIKTDTDQTQLDWKVDLIKKLDKEK